MLTPVISSLPDWAQTILLIGALAAALTAIILLGRKMFSVLSAWVRAMDEFAQMGPFMERTNDFMKATGDSLAAQDKVMKAQTALTERIQHQVFPNGGGSLADDVKALHEGQTKIQQQLVVGAKQAKSTATLLDKHCTYADGQFATINAALADKNDKPC
jgi:hypothetical protein